MSRFKWTEKIVSLSLKEPFTIARGTKEKVQNVVVTLTADGITGFGEAAPNKRYNEDAETVLDYIEALDDDFLDALQTPEEVAQKLQLISPSVKSAQSAIEMAWLDWWAKSQEMPLWKLWEAPSNTTPPTSFTIGLDEIDVMQQKVEDAAEYPILKVKLGTNRDRDIIKAIRSITGKAIRVDANEGWDDLSTAKEHIDFLADQNIQIIEQPMPAGKSEEMVHLKEWSPLPLVADESFKGDEDLDRIARSFDGINIKLAKIGSLVKARNVISAARKRNLQVMVGCMVESSLGIAAAALIGTWADYVDLDGHLLIANDPFKGLDLNEEKAVVLKHTPGLGISLNQ